MLNHSHSLTFLLGWGLALELCGGTILILVLAIPCPGDNPQAAEHVPPAALREDALCPTGSRGLHPGQQQLLLHRSIQVGWGTPLSLSPVPGEPWQTPSRLPAQESWHMQDVPKGHRGGVAGREGRVVQAKRHLCCHCHRVLMQGITLGLLLVGRGESGLARILLDLG